MLYLTSHNFVIQTMNIVKLIKFAGARFLISLIGLLTLSNPSSGFEIHAFLPYPSASPSTRSLTATDDLEQFGINKITVIYENELLDPLDESSPQKNGINESKIKSTAIKYISAGKTIFSLDIESWNRFEPATPSLYLKVLKIFKQANPDALVGLYATVPQNTYIWAEEKRSFYDNLNNKYADVAKAVDYFSPSLYNYSGDDLLSWKENAAYNIAAAKKYDIRKKIIPYITPEVHLHGSTRLLSYDEMKARLEALRTLGADGCIIWGSSRFRTDTGSRPTLDPESGWLKAVIDFSHGL